jgi:hypothetical protein
MESVEGCLGRPFVSKIDLWMSFGETGNPALLDKGSGSSIRDPAVSRPFHNLAFLHLGLSSPSFAWSTSRVGRLLEAEAAPSWPTWDDEPSILSPL